MSEFPTTAEAFLALPVGGGFGMREMVIDGKTVNAVVPEHVSLVFVPEGVPMRWMDADGQKWKLGRLPDGRLCRVRSYGGL